MKKEIALLIRKFLLGKSSPEEDRQLDTWYGKPSRRRIRLSDAEWQEIKDRIWHSIAVRTRKPVTRPVYIRMLRPLAAAAAVAVLLPASRRLLRQEWNSGNPQSEQLATVQVKDLSHILRAVEYSMDVRIERTAENRIVIINKQ